MQNYIYYQFLYIPLFFIYHEKLNFFFIFQYFKIEAFIQLVYIY